MNIDGLWLSGITLHIDRRGLPIPQAMQDKPIVFKLSDTQMMAVSVLLGLGLSDGELLSYTDDVLTKILTDETDDTLKREYKAVSSGMKANRRRTPVFTPVAQNPEINQRAWDNDEKLSKSSGYFSLADAEAADIQD